jgi:tagaturonate reductase
MNEFPETILQFGTGRFLRAFVDRFVHEANVGGQKIGSIVVVQSTGTDAADLLNASKGIYHIAVRGLENGEIVRRDEVASISRALSAGRDWNEVLNVARSPDLKFVISNTTEKGYDLDPEDIGELNPPRSFPAKLLAVLRARFEAGLPGLTIIPCELRDNQADELLGIVTHLAEKWGAPARLLDWIQTRCVWLNTLVDRIVVAGPTDHPLAGKDPLLIMAEPFAFWALQSKPNAFPFVENPAIVPTEDVRPYFLRKVRILNAAHTALVTRARNKHETVIQAINDRELAAWLERLLMEEIVPAVRDDVDGAELFARQTLERFRNPFLAHKVADILKNHETKVGIRLAPTRDDFRRKLGREPALLNEVLRENGL